VRVPGLIRGVAEVRADSRNRGVQRRNSVVESQEFSQWRLPKNGPFGLEAFGRPDRRNLATGVNERRANLLERLPGAPSAGVGWRRLPEVDGRAETCAQMNTRPEIRQA
jgi:hypothetical protein